MRKSQRCLLNYRSPLFQSLLGRTNNCNPIAGNKRTPLRARNDPVVTASGPQETLNNRLSCWPRRTEKRDASRAVRNCACTALSRRIPRWQRPNRNPECDMLARSELCACGFLTDVWSVASGCLHNERPVRPLPKRKVQANIKHPHSLW